MVDWYDGVSLSPKKERSSNTGVNTDAPVKHILSERSPTQKPTCCMTVYIKCPQYDVYTYTYVVSGEGWRVTADRHEVSSGLGSLFSAGWVVMVGRV